MTLPQNLEISVADLQPDEYLLFAAFLAALHRTETFLRDHNLAYGDVIAFTTGDQNNTTQIGMIAYPWLLPLLQDGQTLWRDWATRGNPDVYLLASYLDSLNYEDSLVLIPCSRFRLLRLMRAGSPNQLSFPHSQLLCPLDSAFVWLQRQVASLNASPILNHIPSSGVSIDEKTENEDYSN